MLKKESLRFKIEFGKFLSPNQKNKIMLIKKLSLSILSLFFVLSIAYPQTFDFGVSFKMISSDILTNDITVDGISIELETHRGWSWGAAALAKYSFTENWSIIAEPGFYFTKFGQDITTAIQPTGQRADLEHYYISLPILLQYRLWDRLGIELGPELNYLINFESNSTVLSKSNYESVNLAAMASLQFAVLDFLDLGLRYNRGLTPFLELNITDQNGQPTNNYYKNYHESYQVSLRFWF
ncbi:MAG: hypothetical protein EA362_10450 [Saprospirales bacterium]|nr:MAG: hypothetical protein EA362_10450 [Saprospirales bacterium]